MNTTELDKKLQKLKELANKNFDLIEWTASPES